MKITSTPAVGDTYTLGETVQVTATFDKYVVWDVSAQDAYIRIQFEEGPLDIWPLAYLVTGGRTTATVLEMVFEHTVTASDTSPDGLLIHDDAGIPIRERYGATIVSEHGDIAVLSYGATKLPGPGPRPQGGRFAPPERGAGLHAYRAAVLLDGRGRRRRHERRRPGDRHRPGRGRRPHLLRCREPTPPSSTSTPAPARSRWAGTRYLTSRQPTTATTWW